MRRAVVGLRAFDKLIAISQAEGESKAQMIQEFCFDSDLVSCFRGTNTNPAFGDLQNAMTAKNTIRKQVVENQEYPLWNLTKEENEPILSQMCQRAGMVFERTIDFERKVVGRRQQQGEDDSQLTELYNITSEATVFMFQTFNNLGNLIPEDKKQIVVDNFVGDILFNQGWSNISRPFENEQGEDISLKEVVLKEITNRTNGLLSLVELDGNIKSDSNQSQLIKG